MAYILLIFTIGFSAEDVEYIGNREYIPNLVKSIKNAEKTIDVAMYSAGYYPQYTGGPDREVYGAMFDAVKRGVKIRVILDASDWNTSNTRKNQITADYLKSGGVKVWWDPPDITTHSKIVIIDTLYCIVGSTNWTYYAFVHNNETSLLVKSRPLAERLEKFFSDLLRVSTVEQPLKTLKKGD